MIRLTFSLLLTCCFAVLKLSAQNTLLEASIPKNPVVVVAFHGGTLQKNIDINQLKEGAFVQKYQQKLARKLGGSSELDTTFIELIGQLDKNGVNTQSTSYLYVTIAPELVAVTYLMALSDEAQFASFAKNYISEDKQTLLASINGMKGYKIKDNNTFITWNSKLAKVTSYMANDLNKKDTYNEDNYYDYGYDTDINEDSLAAAKEAEEIVNQLALEAKMIQGVTDSYSLTAKESVMNSPGFSKSINQSGDITVWAQNTALWQFDNATLLKLFPKLDRMALPVIDKIKSMYKDAYVSANIHLKNTGVVVDMESHTSDELAKYTKLITKSKFEKSLLKYIPNDYVACYASTFNPSALTPITKELIYPIIQEVPQFGTRVTDVLDIIDVFIDEEAIYDLIEGDVVALFSGTVTVMADSTYYEYDEDYNYEVKTKSYEKTIPKVTFMMTTKDEETWRKIISLPSIVPFFTHLNGLYTFEKDGIKLFFTVYDGVVIMTTDELLVTDYLASGLPKDQRLSGDNLKELTATNNLIKIKSPDLEIDNKEYLDFQNLLKKVQFESLVYSGGQMKGNASLSHAEINFGDKKQNIVNFLVAFVDELMMSSADNLEEEDEMEMISEEEEYEEEEIEVVEEY